MKSIYNPTLRTRLLLILTVFLFLISSLLITGCSDREGNQPASITVMAVGDTNGYNIFLNTQEPENPLQSVNYLLNGQDIFIFNYEGVILPEAPAAGILQYFPNQSNFWNLPPLADFLHPANLNIASLANNHILDGGDYGIQETIRELTSRGINTVGAGLNSEAAYQPIEQRVNGVSVAVAAYLAIDPDLFAAGEDTAGAAAWNDDTSEQQIAQLAAENDVVLVILHIHLGQGWTDQPSPEQIDLVKRALDAGADVVIASGPHIPQGIIVSNGGIGLLSLGNFLFCPDYEMPDGAYDSVIVKITISSDNLNLTLFPLRLDASGKPGIPEEEKTLEILNHIAGLSSTFGTIIDIEGETGYIEVQREPGF
jgi:hypothetical protein